MSAVIDSSVTLAWLYSDKRSEPIERVFAAIAETGGWVPAIWRLEVASGLQQGVRRRRIDSDYRDQALADLADLDIATDAETDTYAWNDTLHLADRFQLTLYDASYLELARRLKLPLATLDRELQVAARSIGVKLLT